MADFKSLNELLFKINHLKGKKFKDGEVLDIIIAPSGNKKEFMELYLRSDDFRNSILPFIKEPLEILFIFSMGQHSGIVLYHNLSGFLKRNDLTIDQLC